MSVSMQLQRSSTEVFAAAAADPEGVVLPHVAAAVAAAAAALAAATAAAAVAGVDRDTHYRKSPWAAEESRWAAGCWGRSRR